MNNKAHLPLMEQLIMILIFALAAGLCLQGFSLADRISRKQESRAGAIVAAQNAAEILKNTSGDFEEAAIFLGGYYDDTTWTVPYDDSWQLLPSSAKAVYLLETNYIGTDNPHLGMAQIRVFYDNEVLFEITVGWQEENVYEYT